VDLRDRTASTTATTTTATTTTAQQQQQQQQEVGSPASSAVPAPAPAPATLPLLRGFLSSAEGDAAAERAAVRRPNPRVLVVGGQTEEVVGGAASGLGIPSTASGRRFCSAAAQADAVIVLSPAAASALDASGCVEPGMMVPGFEYARYGGLETHLPRLVHVTAAWLLQGAPVRSLAGWVRDDVLFSDQ
jgi:hypothetical protein